MQKKIPLFEYWTDLNFPETEKCTFPWVTGAGYIFTEYMVVPFPKYINMNVMALWYAKWYFQDWKLLVVLAEKRMKPKLYFSFTNYNTQGFYYKIQIFRLVNIKL